MKAAFGCFDNDSAWRRKASLAVWPWHLPDYANALKAIQLHLCNGTGTPSSHCAGKALFKIKWRDDHFTTQEIASEIETEVDEKLHDGALRDIQKILQGRGDVQKIMQVKGGPGIEPALVGAQLWKFGNGKPPVRRPIGHPSRR